MNPFIILICCSSLIPFWVTVSFFFTFFWVTPCLVPKLRPGVPDICWPLCSETRPLSSALFASSLLHYVSNFEVLPRQWGELEVISPILVLWDKLCQTCTDCTNLLSKIRPVLFSTKLGVLLCCTICVIIICLGLEKRNKKSALKACVPRGPWYTGQHADE